MAVSGNFTAELLGCQTQNLLTNNMVAKHIVLLSIIYFTMDSDQLGYEPHLKFIFSLLMWFSFLLYTHLSADFTIIVTIGIIGVLILNDYIRVKYIREKKNPSTLILIQKILYLVLFITVLVGFVLYYLKQANDHKDSFSFFKFLLGTKKCDSLSR